MILIFNLILIKYYCYANFVKQCLQFIPVILRKYDTDKPLCKNLEDCLFGPEEALGEINF